MWPATDVCVQVIMAEEAPLVNTSSTADEAL